MSDEFGSKEWQRAKLSEALNSIFFSGEVVIRDLLAVHCTMDVWMAVGKVYDCSGEENNHLSLDEHINEYKLSLAGCDNELVDPFIMPLKNLQQKFNFVGGWFTGYKIEMEKQGLFGIRFDPEIIFELGFTYASNHHKWITWNHERMTAIASQSDDEKSILSDDDEESVKSAQGSNTDSIQKVLKKVVGAILSNNDEVYGHFLSMHSTTDIFKAIGQKFTPGQVANEQIPELLHGYIRQYRDALNAFGFAKSAVNALIAPLLRFENKVRIQPEWFNQYLSANEEYGLFGVRFPPSMIFEELGYKYANAENRSWAIMNNIYMVQRENRESSNCTKSSEENLQFREHTNENKENLKELESFVSLMFAKLEKEVKNNTANINKTNVTLEGLLNKKSDEGKK